MIGLWRNIGADVSVGLSSAPKIAHLAFAQQHDQGAAMTIAGRMQLGVQAVSSTSSGPALARLICLRTGHF